MRSDFILFKCITMRVPDIFIANVRTCKSITVYYFRPKYFSIKFFSYETNLGFLSQLYQKHSKDLAILIRKIIKASSAAVPTTCGTSYIHFVIDLIGLHA